jgi:hypothetical protein
MSNPRKPIAELKLQGSPNLGRALSYAETKKLLPKREEIESVFADLQERRAELKTEIKNRGLFVEEQHWCGDKVIVKREPNPALKLLTVVERQIASVARLLAMFTGADDSNATKNALDRELDAIRAEMN